MNIRLKIKIFINSSFKLHTEYSEECYFFEKKKVNKIFDVDFVCVKKVHYTNIECLNIVIPLFPLFIKLNISEMTEGSNLNIAIVVASKTLMYHFHISAFFHNSTVSCSWILLEYSI